MIFSTVCYGDEYIARYSDRINKFAANNKVYILTDQEHFFPNCDTINYLSFTGKHYFSYFSKILFLLELIKTHQKRVTYVDADFMHPNLKYSIFDLNDTSKIFTSRIYNPDYLKNAIFKSATNVESYKEILDRYRVDHSTAQYITEAFISFPYDERIESITKLAYKLEKDIESTFNADTVKWKNTVLQRYTKYGVGFAEGTALTILVNKFNFTVEGVEKNSELLLDKGKSII